jgi:hypothetical protein
LIVQHQAPRPFWSLARHYLCVLADSQTEKISASEIRKRQQTLRQWLQAHGSPRLFSF